MDQTRPEVPASSPVKPQAAVSPLPIQSDFVEVDLNSPRPPLKVDLELVPPVVAGDLAVPLRNLCPSGSYNGARTAQPSAYANPASNPQLSKFEKPSTSSRRSNNVGSSNPALAPSALPLSTSIIATPSQPGVDPSWGQGQDPMVTCPSNPAVAPSALHLSTSITAAASQPGVDPSGGQGRDPIGARPSNPAVAPSALHLSNSITAAPWGQGQGPMVTCTDGVKSLTRPRDMAMASTAVSCPADIGIRFDNITEAAAKQALLDFGRSKVCYSTAPAKEMTIQDLRHYKTYRYCLETFTEHRSCEWVTEPYVGQTSDTSAGRSAPQAWDVPVAVPQMFQDGVQKMVMPQTSSVQACSKCNGLGRNMCLKCHGTGRAQCMWCNGRGRRMQMEMCQHCYGNGTESCQMCQNPNQQCVSCSGKGQVLTFMRLTVTWKNNVFEFITDHNSEFSTDLFKSVKGEKLFIDEQSTVPGITDFSDHTVIRASQNALEQHRTQFSASCRVLRQRQSIEWLPLSKVQYRWKEKQLNYFVYGKENKVFAQNYPKTCCCDVM